MFSRTSYPPIHKHPHLTKPLSPTEAEAILSTFLAKTAETPHLHPDSLLSGTGIQFPATNGVNGGLAIHNLRRIAAGLRGENLMPETADDLRQFEKDGGLPQGDDSALDIAIAEKTGRRGVLKRSRSFERVTEWEDGSSEQAALGAPAVGGEGDGEEGWQDLREFEQEQRPLEGEVGEREGAPVVNQDGVQPEFVVHDNQGKVVEHDARREAAWQDEKGELVQPLKKKKRGLTPEEKAAKAARKVARAEKRARRESKGLPVKKKATG